MLSIAPFAMSKLKWVSVNFQVSQGLSPLVSLIPDFLVGKTFSKVYGIRQDSRFLRSLKKTHFFHNKIK